MEKNKGNTKRRLLDDFKGESTKNVKRGRVESNWQDGQNTERIRANKNLSKSNNLLKNSCKMKRLTGKNNNATIVATKANGRHNSNVISGQKLLKTKLAKGKTRSTLINSKGKQITPIIQTRGMKARAAQKGENDDKVINKNVLTRADITHFDKIDTLTSREIADGEDKVYHDGIKLSIQGSDIDEDFPVPDNNANTHDVSDNEEEGKDTNCDSTEPGEICSSEEDLPPDNNNKKVASKVIKVNKVTLKAEKFNQWQNDPDFKQFLGEVMDEHLAARKPSTPRVQGKSKSEQQSSNSQNVQNIQADSTPIRLIRDINFKSPSDTTIYSPGLRKVNSEDVSLIEKISNFVESIKLDMKRSSRGQTN